jgi:hypothetical protein
MKYIPLRTIPTDGEPLSYGEVIRTVIRQPLEKDKGVSIEEMRKGIRIFDKLDASKDVLELEDADYDHLKAKVEAMQWGMVDRNLLDFIDNVLNAKDTSQNGKVSVEAVKAS